MKDKIKILLGASVVAGITATIFPASAASIKIIGTDYLVYEAIDTDLDGIPDKTRLNNDADIEEVVKGTCTIEGGAIKVCANGSPGGNIELFADSEKAEFKDPETFKNVEPTSIVKTFDDGTEVKLSSLTGKDWFETPDGVIEMSCQKDNLIGRWFNDALNSNGGVLQGRIVALGVSTQEACQQFITLGGPQRLSDPNVSYVNKVGNNIIVGLAGHFDAGNAFEAGTLPSQLFAGIQLSELIKAEFGKTEVLYSFNAFESGLVEEGDNKSQTGEYEVDPTIATTTVEKVPEPSSMLGLFALGGLLFATGKQKKK
ncbi:MAG: NF038130 family PEP-CTERM protein [Spirulinaceae cyanobacterium]